MATSNLTVDYLSNDGNSAKVIYSEPPDYTVQSTELINYSDTNTQVHQPQSTNNINSTFPSINLNRNIIQSTDKINSYIVWSVINIIFCSICLGCVALYYSIKTRDFKREGLMQDALNTSKVARNINIVTTIIGIFGWVILLILLIQFLDQMNSYTVKTFH
ncbi:unnamed protein product [Adineta steineri]|uniref:Interferon-induced transmembrane protein n=1 Tax=Adineta steineri TaxID=433720 RepID=A0A818VWX6_9BILA|nr:unnamed protein product [Adineta steineri]CAF3717304.1 unnamed protein product [Adineta steineri]